MIRRFHLFPTDEARFPHNKQPSEFGDKAFEYVVVGANQDGDKFPDRISIVRGRKQFTCSSCLKTMGKYGNLPYPKRFGIIPYYYVGFVDGSCFIPRWGYEVKICMACGLKYLGDHYVYPCSVGKDFCEEVWGAIIPRKPIDIVVPYEKRTLKEYVEDLFTVRNSGGKQA